MKYLLTRVHSNLQPNKKNKILEKMCRRYIGTESTSEEYKVFAQHFVDLVEKLNKRFARTTPLIPIIETHYFSAILKGTDKSLYLNFEEIQRSYTQLVHDVINTENIDDF